MTVPGDADPGRIAFDVTARAGRDESKVACVLEIAGGTSARPIAQPAASIAAPGVTLSPQRLTWRRGGPASEELTLSVRNVGGEDAEYALTLSGIPEGWHKLPPRITAPARQRREVRLNLTPGAQARQGDYTITVRAADSREATATAEASATLSVTGAAETPPAPQRAVSPVVVEAPVERRTAAPVLPPEVTLGPRSTFRFGPGEVTSQATITVVNTSRLIERYQIAVRGIDEDWYQLARAEISLHPAASQQIPLRLTPRTGGHPHGRRLQLPGARDAVQLPGLVCRGCGDDSIAGQMSFDARVTPNRRTGRKEKFKLTLLNTGGLQDPPVAGGIRPRRHVQV